MTSVTESAAEAKAQRIAEQYKIRHSCAEVSRRRFAFWQGKVEGVDQASMTGTASEAKAQRSKRDNAHNTGEKKYDK